MGCLIVDVKKMYWFEVWYGYFDDLDVFVAANVRLEGGFQVGVCI